MTGKKRTRMAKVALNVRVDPNLKEQAEELYGKLGINLSQAVNVFLAASVMHGGLPFDLALPEREISAESQGEDSKK